MTLKEPVFIAIISLVLLAAGCSMVTKPSKPQQKNTPHAMPQTKQVDRGFDPCLLNSKLAVCGNNENSNRK
ncbi:MAG: hypothetical protein OEY11_08575 [Gammaproteobacteria bacterium]|nr:hypothetical protein [Gammaproteobacteria bacterium]